MFGRQGAQIRQYLRRRIGYFGAISPKNLAFLAGGFAKCGERCNTCGAIWLLLGQFPLKKSIPFAPFKIAAPQKTAKWRIHLLFYFTWSCTLNESTC
jgi:hypothetical protein